MSNFKHSAFSSHTTWKRLELNELHSEPATASPSPEPGKHKRQSPEAFSPKKLNRNALQKDASNNAIPEDVLQEISRIGQSARKLAEQKGYQEGLQRGLEEGLESSKKEGYQSGHDEGYQDGHKEGYETGLQEGQTLGNEEVQRLSSIANDLSESVALIDQKISEALVTLALDIARQVVRATLSVKPGVVLDTVQDVLLTEVPDQSYLHLRLHPEDLALVRRHLKDDPRLQKWRLQSDETLERGGCVAETALGSTDATLQTRWNRVAGLLRENSQWLEAD